MSIARTFFRCWDFLTKRGHRRRMRKKGVVYDRIAPDPRCSIRQFRGIVGR